MASQCKIGHALCNGMLPLLGDNWGFLIMAGPQRLSGGHESPLWCSLQSTSLVQAQFSVIIPSLYDISWWPQEGSLCGHQLSLHTILAPALAPNPFLQGSFISGNLLHLQPLGIDQHFANVPLLDLPGVTPLGAAVGFWSLCSQKDGIPFCKSIQLFCSHQLCMCQGSGALAGSQKSHTLFPQGGGCAQGPYCTIKRPTEVSQCVQGQLLYIKKKKSQQVIGFYSSLFQIRKPGTRDHKGLIQSHTALTLTQLLIPLWVW